MTRYDDETLMRRIDGEMPVAERDRIDAAAASDADLAARLAALRTTGALRARPSRSRAMRAMRIWPGSSWRRAPRRRKA